MSTIVPSIASSFPQRGDDVREAGMKTVDHPTETAYRRNDANTGVDRALAEVPTREEVIWNDEGPTQ